MQTVNLLRIELKLRVEGSNIYHLFIKHLSLLHKSLKKNLLFSLKPGLKSSSVD